MGEITQARARSRSAWTLALLAATIVTALGLGLPAMASADPSSLPSVVVNTPGTVVDDAHATTDHRPTWTWSTYVPDGPQPEDTFVTAQCRIDAGSWILCNPLAVPSVSFRPTVLQSLADGTHTVDVRWARYDIDAPSAPVEEGPATATSILVDSTGPELVATVPAGTSTAQLPSLDFTQADAGVGIDPATVACRVHATDEAAPAFVPCTSPFASPALKRNTNYTFEVTATDRLGTVSTTSETWDVLNTAPATPDAPETVHSGSSVAIDLPATDTDGDALTFTATDPDHGSIDRSALGAHSVTYTAPADFVGDATFTYTADDGREGGSSTGTITVTVANTAPDTPDLDLDAESGDHLPVALPATDADDDALTFTVTDPIQVDEQGDPILDGTDQIKVGTLDVTDLSHGNVVLAAPATFSGKVAFTYTADDGRAQGQSSGTVVVTVTPQTSIVDEPIADGNAQRTTNETTLTWSFESPVADATFECRLVRTDADPVEVVSDWATCGDDAEHPGTFTSPADLDEGTYELSVRAQHDAGFAALLVDPTPATSSVTVDTTAPDVVVDTQPDPLNNDADPTTTFSSTDDTTSFTCTLTYQDNDGGDPVQHDAVDCGTAGSGTFSPPATPADGIYSVSIAPRDPAGNVGTSETVTWETDRTAPTLTQTAGIEDGGVTSYTGPGGEVRPQWSFTYADRNIGSNIPQCALFDDGDNPTPAADCDDASVPGVTVYRAPQLNNRTYGLRTSVTDDAGNTTELPVDFSVDTLFPTARIVDAPATTGESVTFHFAADEDDVTYTCQLVRRGQGNAPDTVVSDWAACDADPTFSGLTDGRHTLRVKAVDRAGNEQRFGGTSATFTVNTAVPTVTIATTPDAETSSTTAVFTFTSNTAGADLYCRVDTGDWVGCSADEHYVVTGLQLGSHTLAVHAVDPDTNAAGPDATYTWTIVAPAASGGPDVATVPGGGLAGEQAPAAGGSDTPPATPKSEEPGSASPIFTAPIEPAPVVCRSIAAKAVTTKRLAAGTGATAAFRLASETIRLGDATTLAAVFDSSKAKSAFARSVSSVVVKSGSGTVATLKGTRWTGKVTPRQAGNQRLSVTINRKHGKKSIKTALTLKVVGRCA